ncbi:MAG: cation diffusion facilitator family transporter [Elusimicrobia bacterium]|nr:cation diffusion facilitator family transporter [Elusimicrobiota bacterium]
MYDQGKCVRCAYNLTWFGLWDSLLLGVFKGVVGYYTHSRALTMSAVYSIHDVISALAILLGLKVAENPADAAHPYGYGAMEDVVSLVTGLIIFAATLLLLGEAVWALAFGRYPQPHWTALIGALIAALVNETIYHFNICAYRRLNSPAILTHARHHRADALSSVAAVLAILGAKLGGWHFLDPLVAILEAAHLLVLSGEILRHASLGLLDRAPKKAELEAIHDIAQRVAGPGAARRVKARQVGRSLWVDLTLKLPPELPMSRAQELAQRISGALRRGVKHVGTVNVIYE